MRKVLKASAGTGKTYRLSLEYLAAIIKGEDFEEILVMTFTRKATAELRERVFEQMEDILNHGQDSDIFQSLRKIYPTLELNINILKDEYNMMLKNKDRIKIYTIDSFINKIFKQAIAPYLGIYSYQIADENKNEEIIEEVFRELLNKSADFALMERFLRDNTERYIKHYLDLIREILNNRWKFLLINYQKRPDLDTTSLTNYLDECQNILESIAEEKGKDFSSSFYVKDFQSLLPEYCNLNKIEDKKEKIIKNYQLFVKNSFWNGNKIRGKAVADLRDSLELKYQDFLKELAAYIYNEEMIPYEEEIFKFSTRIFEIYDKLKFKEKVFTHTDISNYTYKYFYELDLDLLEDNSVSQYFFELLGSNVNTLFIDEFQDTSILQWKILKPLINRCKNIITVGDEKQSIYGWRGGEKELFNKLEEILEGEEESLLTCYRSEKEIVEFINKFFINLDIDWDYSNVEYLGKKKQGFVELLLGGKNCKTNTDTKAFKKLSTEKQEEIIELNQKITGNLKKEIASSIKSLPAYNNIAVLARSNKDLLEIGVELNKEGIPYILESKDSLFEHEAIKPLYFLLNYLNYHDYFHLIKFLRSDLVSVNNSTLRYILANKEEVEAFMIGEKKTLKYDFIQNLLREIRKMDKMRYKELSNYLIEYSGVLKKYHDNNTALKNINYFFQLLRSFNSLGDLMIYIRENKESEELKQLTVKENNAIQLMTIHKAKGLSFETEFFYWNPSPSKGASTNTMELYISFDENYQEVTEYLLTNSRYERLFEYLGISFAKTNERREVMEEINNLYVALSRPEKNLFLYIEGPRKLAEDKEGRCWRNSSYEYYEDALLNSAQINSICELLEKKQLGYLRITGDKEKITDPLLADLSDFFKPNTLSEEILKEADYQKDFSMNILKEIKRIEGLAIHYYLEYIKYNTEREKRYARKMVFARYGNILGPLKLQEIIQRVNSFIDQNKEYFKDGWQVYTEYELVFEDKSYRIDQLRVNKENKEIIILDYKSGITKEQAQLDKYKEIITEKTMGKYKIQSIFIEI